MMKKIVNTLNGALNKLLIDNFIVTRRADGSELSEKEIMQLTRPYFRATEISEMPATPAESNEFHREETPAQKQFGGTIRMAAAATDEVEAARMFVGTIYPMCNAMSESPEGKSISLYNAEQMITAFVAGQQWLRDKCARLIQLDFLTLEDGFALLKEYLFSLPPGMSTKQAIEHLKQLDDPKKGL